MVKRMIYSLDYGANLILNCNTEKKLMHPSQWLRKDWFGEHIMDPEKFLDPENISKLGKKYK